MEVQARMADLLERPRSAIHFPALKDKRSVAVQHAAVRGPGPALLEGKGFNARRLGWAERPLRPSDIRGNRFTLVVRDLSSAEAELVRPRLEQLAETGLPNYYDQQRFGSWTEGGDPVGRRILLRDAEGALRAHLAEPMVGDPPDVLALKRVGAEHWGQWDRLFDAAPKPSNFRSVLTYLRDHPTDFRKALNLVSLRVQSIYVGAYQSLLWNLIVARYLRDRLGEVDGEIEVASVQLPLFQRLVTAVDLESVPLPHHRATYGDPALAAAAEAVLDEQQITMNDLKPRILRDVYLPKGERALCLVPEDVSVAQPEPDETHAGRSKLTLSFELPRGSYATLVVKAVIG
jgi:tRNA pseudouridine13 synthase